MKNYYFKTGVLYRTALYSTGVPIILSTFSAYLQLCGEWKWFRLVVVSTQREYKTDKEIEKGKYLIKKVMTDVQIVKKKRGILT